MRLFECFSHSQENLQKAEYYKFLYLGSLEKGIRGHSTTIFYHVKLRPFQACERTQISNGHLD